MNDLTSLFNELTTSYAEFDNKQNKKNSANVRKLLMSLKIECATLRQSVLNQVKKKVVEPVASELQVEPVVEPVGPVEPVEPVEPVASELQVEPVAEPVGPEVIVKKEKKEKKEKKRKIEKMEKKTTIRFN